MLTIISQKIIMHNDLVPEKCLVFISGDECDEHPAGTICRVFFFVFFYCGFSCKLVLEEVLKMIFSGSSGAGEQTAALFCLHLVLL